MFMSIVSGVGYLGLTQILDENAEVLMLVTNSIKNDMATDKARSLVSVVRVCTIIGQADSWDMCICDEV